MGENKGLDLTFIEIVASLIGMHSEKVSHFIQKMSNHFTETGILWLNAGQQPFATGKKNMEAGIFTLTAWLYYCFMGIHLPSSRNH